MDKLKIKFNLLYGPAVISGLLLVFSFPKFDLYPLAWISIAPLLIFLYGKDASAAFRSGFVFGVIYFFGTTYWIYHSVHYYGSIGLIPSLFLVLLLCLYLAIYPAVFSSIYASLIRKTNLPAMLIAPALWTSLEYVRAYALTGFPWSSLGYSQYKFIALTQIADITGIYGVSFLVMAFNAALADYFIMKKRRLDRPLYPLIPTLASYAVLTLFVIFTLSYGIYRLYEQPSGRIIKAAVIQGNIDQNKKWDPTFQKEVIETYRNLSAKASSYSPEIIIWPETAVPFYFKYDVENTGHLVNFQQSLNAYLLFGSVLNTENSNKKRNNDPDRIFTNSVVLLDKNGNTSYIYDKIHLVPFGEYVPLRKLLFFVDKLVYGVGDYSSGNSFIKAVTPFGSFGTLVCYEIVFPGLVRKFYRSGGDFIVTITNDAWFGKTNGPYQHFSMAVFRAIENRKPVIRAANTGISGVIDTKGRVQTSTKLFEQTFFVENIITNNSLTLYTKYGDIFTYFCIVWSVVIILKESKFGGK
jgi:apolipoprotein N-acyltransferase